LTKSHDETNNEKISPFDFIKSVTHNKKNLMESEEIDSIEAEKSYNAYVVNRGLSYFIDTILHANEMNQRPNLFSHAQYHYYLQTIRPKKRFSKWFKPEKDEALDFIQEYYQCNRSVAKMYLKSMTDEQLKEFCQKSVKN